MLHKNLSISILLCAILVFVSASLLHSQNPAPPDLSGTWQLNISKSKVPKSAKNDTETLTITYSGPNMLFHYLTNGKESHELYVADGKEKTIAKVSTGEVVTKAQWKGTVLTTETINRMTTPGTPSLDRWELYHDKERWQLSSDGQLLTCEWNAPRQTRVYDKVPQ